MSVNLMKVWGPDGDVREVSHLCARDLVQHKGWTVTGPVVTEVAAPTPAVAEVKVEEKPAEVELAEIKPAVAEVKVEVKVEEKSAEGELPEVELAEIKPAVAEVKAEEKTTEKPKRGRPAKK